jgi:hypothetical protein
MHCDITYEQLAAWSCGDVPAAPSQAIEQHVESCDVCRRRLVNLKTADAAMRLLRPLVPPAETILAARRLLSEEIRPSRQPDILTLEEVAAFLRIDAGELRPFVEELPAFELGGSIRVRRSRLLEWIEQRERQFSRGTAASTIARIAAGRIRKGVA